MIIAPKHLIKLSKSALSLQSQISANNTKEVLILMFAKKKKFCEKPDNISSLCSQINSNSFCLYVLK
jgi:hypothetical protein